MEMELISDQCVPPLPASGVVTLKRSPLSPLLWNLVGYLAPPLILFPTVPWDASIQSDMRTILPAVLRTVNLRTGNLVL